METEQNAVFDELAEMYDISFTETPLGRMQRERVHHFLEKPLDKKSLRILEINCGTGEDAIRMALKNHEVIATDISSKMIDITKEKIRKQNIEKLFPIRASFSELSFPPESFDMIFSNFGGLNCIPIVELEQLKSNIVEWLKPEGTLIAVVMGRKCLWERLYFILKGKSGEAFRRNKKGPVEARVGDGIQPTWYYSPAEFNAVFKAHFRMIKLKPVGFFIPPSYLNNFFTKRKWLLDMMNKLEAWSAFSILADYADHYYTELKKIE